MSRPEHLIVVTGTGTEVGKTWITARLAERLRAARHAVACRKPAQSFDPADATTDAAELGAASGSPAETVCPAHRWYPAPLAPPMAADVLGLPRIAMDDLLGELDWPAGTGIGFVEGAGGLCSPLAHDGDTLDLVRRLAPDLVLLVADPALGVVSSVRLTLAALAGTPTLVVLNRFDRHDDVHRASRAWLSEVDGLRVVTDGELATDDVVPILTARAV